MAITRYTKNGAGSFSGEDWGNASAFFNLGRGLAGGKPGDAFLIGFDRDREDPIFWPQLPLAISTSGSPGKSIRVEAGYSGHPIDVYPVREITRSVFFKKSSAWSTARARRVPAGSAYFVLPGDVSHVDIAGFGLQGVPVDGFVKFRKTSLEAKASSISLQGITATRVGRIVETDVGTHLTSCQVEDCNVSELVRGFARFRRIDDSVLRHLYLDASGVDAGAGNVCQMIAVEAGSNLLFENIYMRNAINMLDASSRSNGTEYVQGDGIVAERNTANFLIRDCHAIGMGDSGFDLKTNGVVLEDCSAYRCKFGMRIWSEADNRIVRCAVGNPRTTGSSRGACVQVAGRVAILDSTLHAGRETSIFRLGGSSAGAKAKISMYGGSIRLEGAAFLASGDTGSVLELHDVAVNGSLRSETFELKNQPIEYR